MIFQAYSLSPQLLATCNTQIERLYKGFEAEAMTRYGWELPPGPWSEVKPKLIGGDLQGTLVMQHSEPSALLLYRVEPHRVIEINMLIAPEPFLGNREVLDVLMRHTLADMLNLPEWDVISFAMLGCQGRWIHTIGWYGFHPVGQAIVALNFMDLVSVQVFAKQALPPLGEGYRLVSWQDFTGSPQAVAEVIRQAFGPTHDALWDPRFKTVSGCEQLLAMILDHQIGEHLADCSQVLLQDETPVGVCFLLQTGPMLANIPLIGVIPGLHQNGLGKQLLSATVRAAISRMIAETLLLKEITATTDTERYPALQMYRRFGFQERANYPHAYLPRTELEKRKDQYRA